MASKQVNKAVDINQKDVDVNNKLQLYGIYAAFAQGKVPSNKQIDIALNSAIQSEPLSAPSEKLSPEGRKLVADLRDIIEKAKLLVLTKNDGNLLQDFIWQTTQFQAGDITAPSAPVDKDTAKQHGQEALEGLRTLGTLLITNGQFRKLLNDGMILLRSIAGDAATSAASRVNPTEEQLAQIDNPAEDNTWHDAPDLSAANLKAQMKTQYDKNVSFGKKEAEKAAGDVAEGATGTRDPAEATEIAQTQGGDPAGAKNAASENVPEDAKKTTKKWQEETRNYFAGKMPEGRREQTIWRLKKMVIEIQGHQDYQRAIETLLRLVEDYARHVKNVGQQGSTTAKGFRSNDSVSIAEADLKTLVERFANSTSLDDLFDAIRQIYRDADHDQEFKDWFKSVNVYIRKCLQEQGFVLQDAANEEWNQLYDHGQHLLRGKYRAHTDRVLDEAKFLSNQFEEDRQNKEFGESVRKLFLDLGNDEESGKPTFKPHLVKDLSEVIIPSFLESVRYVPVPRIEYTDKQVDVVIENLVIESDNLAPNVLEFSSDNYWRWGRKQIKSKNKNKVMLAVSGIQMDLRDVSFYVKRKKGFPSLSDTGVADILLPGEGLSFKIEMETASEMGGHHFFKVNKVKADIKGLSIKLKKSRHKLLFTIAKPLLLRIMRPALSKIVEKQIKDSADQLDALMWQVHQEAKKAESDFKRNPDPENAKSIWHRYVEAGNRQILQGKKKAQEIQEAVADKKVNMAITTNDSIFPNIKLPGGISTKAAEYKELAGKGEKWESPVFTIGSAKETSEVPKIPSIARKSGGGRMSSMYAGTEGFSQEVNQAFDMNGSAPPRTAV